MDSQAFEVLEKKINNVLSMLDRLKKEKEELLQKNQELQSLIKEKDDTIQTLKTEIERHNKAQIEVDTYRENFTDRLPQNGLSLSFRMILLKRESEKSLPQLAVTQSTLQNTNIFPQKKKLIN